MKWNESIDARELVERMRTAFRIQNQQSLDEAIEKMDAEGLASEFVDPKTNLRYCLAREIANDISDEFIAQNPDLVTVVDLQTVASQFGFPLGAVSGEKFSRLQATEILTARAELFSRQQAQLDAARALEDEDDEGDDDAGDGDLGGDWDDDSESREYDDNGQLITR